MPNQKSHRLPTRAHIITEHAINVVERFLHIEALSGVILLIAAAAALIWANSPWFETYDALWHAPLSISIGSFGLSWDLHFWVNDALMTVFFLVAGMEIRREIHEGALSNLRQASLPVVAAIGGVCVPALIYIALNTDPARHHGWAVPTATDIAFAIGILALVGRVVPANLRIMLLSLAIIDDIIAVLIIAVFYSNGLDPYGLGIAAFGIVIVLFFQWIGIASAWAYILPAAVLWVGLLKTGAHPSLAGVILGLMTPVLPTRSLAPPLERIRKALASLQADETKEDADAGLNIHALREIRKGQRDMVAPVTRVQSALHPWVAFVVMPLFAFANAGVRFGGIDLSANGSFWVLYGVGFGLIFGKPIGVLLASFIAVKTGFCRLPPQVTWSGMVLVGLLAGIGFTMAIFVAMLAFNEPGYLAAAKIGVLSGSLASALLGLAYGFIYYRGRARAAQSVS